MTLYFIPESPRWLLEHGKNKEAEKVLRDCAQENGVDLGEFTLMADLKNNIEEKKEDGDSSSPKGSNINCYGSKNTYAEIFSPKFLMVSLIFTLMWCAAHIAYYWV